MRDAAPLAGTIFLTVPPLRRNSSQHVIAPISISGVSCDIPWPGVAGPSSLR